MKLLREGGSSGFRAIFVWRREEWEAIFTKSDLYIYYASAGWWVSDIDDFKDTASSGWCSSSTGEYGHPADAKPWVCQSSEDLLPSPIKVRRKK